MFEMNTAPSTNRITSRAISLGSPSHPEIFGGDMSTHDAEDWVEMNSFDPFDFDGARAYRALI